MIRAMIFDLDGTLVQTERLKALSYARAAVELCPYEISEAEVIDAFKDVVGLSRREVATTLVERFDLVEKSQARMDEFGVDAPWQAYVQVRLRYYREMLSAPDTIRENQWPHTMALLDRAREANCKVALATMSSCDRTRQVLEIIDLEDAFDFVATSDDVEAGKPDPEIYLMVADQLGFSPSTCLVIEDSPSGVEAAINAEMHVVAMSTPFTKKILHDADLLSDEYVVDRPDRLVAIVHDLIERDAQE